MPGCKKETSAWHMVWIYLRYSLCEQQIIFAFDFHESENKVSPTKWTDELQNKQLHTCVITSSTISLRPLGEYTAWRSAGL